jgi:uncharacterized protein (TIGR00730 family)
LKRVCIFSGSNLGRRAVYEQHARALGTLLATRSVGLVYGGASVGLMGVLADAVLRGGGEVIGVIPQALIAREIAHASLSDLRVVGSMHERKSLMSDLADGFIALPGGCGTLDELFEIITWAQLGLHHKPIALLNSGGYFDPLMAAIHHAVEEGFVPRSHLAVFRVASDPHDALELLTNFEAPVLGRKWSTSESAVRP